MGGASEGETSIQREVRLCKCGVASHSKVAICEVWLSYDQPRNQTRLIKEQYRSEVGVPETRVVASLKPWRGPKIRDVYRLYSPTVDIRLQERMKLVVSRGER